MLVTRGKYEGQVATVLSVAAKTCRLLIAGIETGGIKQTQLTVVESSGISGDDGRGGGSGGSSRSIGAPSTPPRQNIGVGSSPENGEKKTNYPPLV